ncbi:hypothetical protein N0V86_002553 [Didymella sp. IMI 355093]|nr:hypothetical protein N0V86_002553 [Didymella sp. IMI 355093]
MVSYILWLVFQLKTHRWLFGAPSQKVPKRRSTEKGEGSAVRGIAAIGAGAAAASGGRVNLNNLLQKTRDSEDEDDEDEFQTPSLSMLSAMVVLIISVVLVAFNTEFATNSIQALLQRHNVSKTFLSLIILPILSNDPIAIKMAMLDKMDISISLTLERCMQTALMVVPLSVLLAWAMGISEMDLKFDGFPITALFASVVIVTYVVQEGKSNW